MAISRGESRERILDVARTHFVERSYDGTTLREIARGAGVTTGALYHHFSGKDAVFVEVCLRGVRSLRRRVDAAAQLTHTRPVPERVIALFDAYASFYLQERGTFELLERLYVNAEQLQIKPELANQVRKAATDLITQMVTILREAEPDLSEDEAVKRAMFAVSMAEGLVAADRKGFLGAFGLSLGSFRGTLLQITERVVLGL